jgi:hypothetical protein
MLAQELLVVVAVGWDPLDLDSEAERGFGEMNYGIVLLDTRRVLSSALVAQNELHAGEHLALHCRAEDFRQHPSYSRSVQKVAEVLEQCPFIQPVAPGLALCGLQSQLSQAVGGRISRLIHGRRPSFACVSALEVSRLQFQTAAFYWIPSVSSSLKGQRRQYG